MRKGICKVLAGPLGQTPLQCGPLDDPAVRPLCAAAVAVDWGGPTDLGTPRRPVLVF
jgi:hypothetical protein